MKRRSAFGWLELVIGILLIVLGFQTFLDPGSALTNLVFLYGFAAVIMGVADIFLYIRVEHYTGFGPVISLISGILSVMSGIMLVVYPRTGVLVLTLLFPIWFIAHCISHLAHLNHIRLFAGKSSYYITLFLNIIGLVLGVLMCFHPLFTLTSIRCFAGIYLFLAGTDAIVIAVGNMGMRK